jgi:hypothetical protein
MKTLLPLFFLLSHSLSAQDKIVTLSNDTVDCTIIDIDENFIQVIVNDKPAKMLFSSVLSVYRNNKWDFNENAFQFSEKEAAEESIMKRQPEFTANGISEKQKNHIYSAGIFLQKGSGKTIGGIAVSLASSAVGILLANNDPSLGGLVAICGSIVGLVLTIDGLSDIGKAGRELQAFPYD